MSIIPIFLQSFREYLTRHAWCVNIANVGTFLCDEGIASIHIMSTDLG